MQTLQFTFAFTVKFVLFMLCLCCVYDDDDDDDDDDVVYDVVYRLGRGGIDQIVNHEWFRGI